MWIHLIYILFKKIEKDVFFAVFFFEFDKVLVILRAKILCTIKSYAY